MSNHLAAFVTGFVAIVLGLVVLGVCYGYGAFFGGLISVMGTVLALTAMEAMSDGTDEG